MNSLVEIFLLISITHLLMVYFPTSTGPTTEEKEIRCTGKEQVIYLTMEPNRTGVKNFSNACSYTKIGVEKIIQTPSIDSKSGQIKSLIQETYRCVTDESIMHITIKSKDPNPENPYDLCSHSQVTIVKEHIKDY